MAVGDDAYLPKQVKRIRSVLSREHWIAFPSPIRVLNKTMFHLICKVCRTHNTSQFIYLGYNEGVTPATDLPAPTEAPLNKNEPSVVRRKKPLQYPVLTVRVPAHPSQRWTENGDIPLFSCLF